MLKSFSVLYVPLANPHAVNPHAVNPRFVNPPSVNPPVVPVTEIHGGLGEKTYIYFSRGTGWE